MLYRPTVTYRAHNISKRVLKHQVIVLFLLVQYYNTLHDMLKQHNTYLTAHFSLFVEYDTNNLSCNADVVKIDLQFNL